MEGLSVGMNLCLDLSVEGLSCCGSGLSYRLICRGGLSVEDLSWSGIVDKGVVCWVFRGGLSWS